MAVKGITGAAGKIVDRIAGLNRGKTTAGSNSKGKAAKILLTSALPYANGPIHIGHLVEYIQTDIYARFLRLTGENVLYCCADDAHGTAIEIRAAKEGITPEELIAKVKREHEDDFRLYHINFDNYYTTHSKENRELALAIYAKLKEKGLIYTKDIDCFFDEKANRFLPDRFIKGKCPRCSAPDQYGDVCEKCNSTYKPTELIDAYSTISGGRPVLKRSAHYFFKLSALSDDLRDYFDSKNFQPEIINYLNNWLDDGLADWDISRDGPYFGFEIPGERDKYFYVWLDAPIGYLASCKNYCENHRLDADDYFHGKDSKIVHVIGKDIMYFHFLFWPAMLMAAGFNLPDDIIVHGFLTVGREKMSKSRGTFITAREFSAMYEPEYLRYYYAKVLSKKMADIDLDFGSFVEAVNSELVANIGNLCYRALSFTERNFGGEIAPIDEKKYPLLGEIFEKAASVRKHYSEFNFNRAVAEIMEISSMGNKFFQENQPWQLRKDGRDEEAKEVCAVSCNIVRVLSIMASPVLPVFAEGIQKQLNAQSQSRTWDSMTVLLRRHMISKAGIIIRKIEKKEEEKFPLDLRVGLVKECRLHPNSGKLVILQIELGEHGNRQIVAGLQKHYKCEELLGKKIVIVSNLKAAKLGGELSQGMLLAACAKDESVIKVIEAQGSTPGDSVTCGEMKSATEEVKYEQFSKLSIVTKGGKIAVENFGNATLRTTAGELSTELEDGYKIS